MSSPERQTANVRHAWPDRAFHWAMALSVLVLLFSAFAPIAGIKFDWVPWHWISGVALTLLLLFHIVRALLVHGISKMLPTGRDLRSLFSRRQPSAADSAADPPKYDIYQKSYHWITALIVGALVVTGVPMLIKLDTPLWDRNPGLLSDLQWGYVYVAHGVGSLLLIFFVIMHVYFALLPEHRLLLLAMLRGGNAHPMQSQPEDTLMQSETH